MKRTALTILSAALLAALPLSASAGYYSDPATDGANPTGNPPCGDAAACAQRNNAMGYMAQLKKDTEARAAGQDPHDPSLLGNADRAQAIRDQQRMQAEAEQRARNQAAAAARAQEEAARNSPAGHIAGAEQQIRYCTARISQARAAMKREKEIEQESGVENLSLRYETGSQIAYCKGQIDVAFREYRQYGGTAPSSDALVRKLTLESQ